MLEMLLSGKKKKGVAAGDYSLFVDVDLQGWEDKVLVDHSPNNVQFVETGNMAYVGYNMGMDVMGDAGKVFRFNGYTFFHASADVLDDISLGSYDIEVGFIKTNSTQEMLFTTGCFAGAYNDPGVSLILDQGSPQVQVFVNKGDTNFVRNYLPGDYFTTFQELVIEKRNSGMRVRNLTRNTEKTFLPFQIPGDTHLTLGGHISGSFLMTRFTGFKYLRIKRVIE